MTASEPESQVLEAIAKLSSEGKLPPSVVIGGKTYDFEVLKEVFFNAKKRLRGGMAP